MDAIVERCCGLDVHQAEVVACLLVGMPGQKVRRTVRRFRTVTQELFQLRDWLEAEGCTHVGMESTGIYWKPVYTILEDHFELIVGNAKRIQNVPGRKTDVKDSEWIADLIRHGLVAKSYVPPKPLRELRDLLRYRRKLIDSRSAERNRLLNVLETANIKLSTFVSDVFGVSGMRMIKALLEGTNSPAQMADLAYGVMRKKMPDLALALDGRIQEHHRFLLRLQLQRMNQAEADIAELDKRIDERLTPYRLQIDLLDQIPGIDRVAAAVVVAEIGVDMSVFHGPHHLASWGGICPGNNESAGKHKKAPTRKGNIHLQATLFEAARAAVSTKGSYFKDKYYRLKTRRGAGRATMAIAHKILKAAYYILLTGTPYKDLGEAYLDEVGRHRTKANLVRRLERLGFDVAIKPKAA
jgi:transposase